ncbi:MAG: hydroxyacylglutathione hydrolase [Halioglobus sp.]
MLCIEHIAAFSDNYIWLLYDDQTLQAWVVDPGEANPVLQALSDKGLTLEGVLITHHHFDHVGGLEALCTQYDCIVYGPQNQQIAGITKRLSAGDKVTVLATEFSVMEVPGHTLDHIAYFHDGSAPVLFCGDTLFAGGCGRVFEGTFPMMLSSLESLAALPEDTRVFCAHEYTLANLAFASAVEPDNSALKERVANAQATRARDESTVPSTLSLELATNPFLRCHQPAMHQALKSQGKLQGETAEQVFATVRGWKDNF